MSEQQPLWQPPRRELIVPGSEQQNLPNLDYALLLPAFNEGDGKRRPDDTFRDAITVYLAGLEGLFEHKDKWALVVGNDGSTDNTAQIAQEEFGLLVIGHADGQNHGRGAMLKRGFSVLSEFADVVAYTDADGSYRVRNIAEQYQEVIDGADIAVAKRPEEQDQHESKLRRYGHTAIYEICEFIASTEISDPQAGLQTFNNEAAKSLWPRVKSEKWAANREVIFLARRSKKADGSDYSVVEREARAEPRGGSSVRKLKDSKDMIADSVVMRIQYAVEQRKRAA
jgi:glycosyltransferase involved in cell wall biosynthesis